MQLLCHRCVLFMGICVMVVLVSAQITFSRDWAGGKRGTSQLGLDCAQFTKLCRHFIVSIMHASYTKSVTVAYKKAWRGAGRQKEMKVCTDHRRASKLVSYKAMIA